MIINDIVRRRGKARKNEASSVGGGERGRRREKDMEKKMPIGIITDVSASLAGGIVGCILGAKLSER